MIICILKLIAFAIIYLIPTFFGSYLSLVTASEMYGNPVSGTLLLFLSILLSILLIIFIRRLPSFTTFGTIVSSVWSFFASFTIISTYVPDNPWLLWGVSIAYPILILFVSIVRNSELGMPVGDSKYLSVKLPFLVILSHGIGAFFVSFKYKDAYDPVFVTPDYIIAITVCLLLTSTYIAANIVLNKKGIYELVPSAAEVS